MDRLLIPKKWHQRRGTRLGFAGGLLLVALYFLVLGSTAGAPRVDRERLTIAPVARGEFQEYIPADGAVQPIRTIYLDAVEGGRIEEIFAEDGQQVVVGQPLLRLANTNLVLDVMYREAQLFEQSNNLRNTRLAMEQRRLDLEGQIQDFDLQIARGQREYDQAATLHEKGLIPRQEYLDAKDRHAYLLSRRRLLAETAQQDSIFREEQLKSLEASVTRMQSNLELIRHNQDNLTLRAPVSGQLSALNAEIGQTKQPGERLGQIDVLDAFKVRAAIDEHFISRVDVGKTADFDLNGHPWRLEVRKVYPEVHDGRFELDFELCGRRAAGHSPRPDAAPAAGTGQPRRGRDGAARWLLQFHRWAVDLRAECRRFAGEQTSDPYRPPESEHV